MFVGQWVKVSKKYFSEKSHFLTAVNPTGHRMMRVVIVVVVVIVWGGYISGHDLEGEPNVKVNLCGLSLPLMSHP